MRKYSQESVVGLFVTVGLLSILYMALRLGNADFLGHNDYIVYATFRKVTGLRAGNPVNIMGMKVGRVNGFRMDQDKNFAVAELRIKKGVRIYEDSIASIRTQGLIGESYIDIEAGGAGKLLGNGDTIIDTVPPVDIVELIGKYAFGDVK